MRIVTSTEELRRWRAGIPTGQSVGFVPTMGALHAGHVKLIETCRRDNAVAVVSIFVNPLQFGAGEDLGRYPRPFERDRELCARAGVDVLFAPEAAAFYAPDHATFCEVEGLDRHLCGASRPGHFRGVCTVVLKLLHLVQPNMAYFGRKDIQQALILKKMTADLSVAVVMVLVETVREASGLALSSRNAYLGEDERKRAASIYQGLISARDAFHNGECDAARLIARVRQTIEASQPTRIDYIELVSPSNLEPLAQAENSDILAAAVYYGTTRLIDNLVLS